MKKSLLALVAALAACSGGGTGKVAVSVHSGGATAAKGALTLGAPAAAALAIGDRVVLERARIVVRKVMLAEATEPAEGTEGTAEEPKGPVLRWDPIVIDLAGADLAGGVKLLLEAEVPAGTYAGLAAQIHKLTPGQAVADADFAALGHSIVLDLTVDGKAVRFVSDLTAVAVLPGPITVAEGGKVNATVSIDPAGWFTGRDGAFLDPALAENQRRIEQNVRASIRGFQDDDRDGEPDPG